MNSNLDKALSVLSKYWGFDSLYSEQEEIISSMLDGKNTISLVPTGGGKSLCFQIPALIKEGTCLVISPLIALIEDQVGRLKSIGVFAEGLHSGLEPDIKAQIENDFVSGKLNLLYISPERLQSPSFREMLTKTTISFVAVDEAHCISQWGYDFRPEYRIISNIRDLFPAVQICAFTATANSITLRDIKKYLRMDSFVLYRSSFLKSNIRFGTIYSENKIKILCLLLNEFEGSGIIYMRSRNGTEILSNKLNRLSYSTLYYHAGMSAEERKEVQEKWLTGETRVIVSTTAFGMGIDKPDVRFVIHYDLPTSIEEFYQEAGRAGRDRKMSDAVILYHEKDFANMKARDIDSFPSLAEIKSTYTNLLIYCNYETGSPGDISFNFDSEGFIRINGLKRNVTFRALAELERFGFIEFSINPKQSRSMIKMLLSDDMLDSLRSKDETAFRILNMIILGANEIFTYKRPVSESRIAELSGIDINIIYRKLDELAEKGHIYYDKIEQDIIITFKNSTGIKPDKKGLKFRKKRLKNNYRNIKSYIGYQDCRQKFVLKYFGEKLKKKCGICDICLKSEDDRFTSHEYAQFSENTKKITEHWVDFQDLIYYDGYLNRHKNKRMLKKMLKEGQYQFRGYMIRKCDAI